MKRTPVLIDVNGVPLRESLSYNGGGAGFGGQMAEWLPPSQSADAALLPALRLGNARADDLVRNNGIAANAVALHKDHIVGHMFLISYRPNWRWLGMRETAAKSFVDEVEAAWSEYAEGMFGEIDVEGKRTFTEFIREGVGVHAFNGEIFVQPVWDTESTQLFRTRFKAVSPKRVDTPGHGIGNRFLRAGVEVDRYGRAVAYHICEDDFAGLGVSYEQLSRDYSKVSYSSARASANESWRYFMGRRKFIASRLATQMFSCWLEEALLRGIIRPPRARFDFYQARSAWSRAEWIGAGRMAIDGLKEVQESVMRIDSGLSTYEKELALMGEDYQDIFRQQVRESAEREKAGLSRPVWIAQAYQQQIAESRRPEEETTPRET
ncbi:phage portal protein [Escherichia coli]|uniref:phage portal protein n=1 Tax=Escherichia coli TaxID=562 RepID=UPI001269FBCE|nr:phage portal protein [Escherichia coli]